jgi:beta-lactamase class D
MKIDRSVRGLVLACTFAVAACAAPPRDDAGDSAVVSAAPDTACAEDSTLARFFSDQPGAFVLLDPQANRTICYNSERARTGFRPASTFKIASTLIALETGVATGPDFALAWDSTRAPRQPWWPATWARDHTLRTALPASVVWFYQEMVRRIGAERMQQYLDDFNYGNRDISGGIDQFWLTGGLRITPMEQIAFLRRFYTGALPVSPGHLQLVKELLVLEDSTTYRLSGKTGWDGLGDNNSPQVGWIVGYLEKGDDVYYFATNIDINSREDAAARLPITRAVLQHLGLIPGAPADSSKVALTVEGEGLRAFTVVSGSARAIPFGSTDGTVRDVIASATGSAPLEDGSTPDCALAYATWPGGLTTTFREGEFVGWSLGGAGPGLTTASGVGIGSSRADLEGAYAVTMQQTSLGTEFSAGAMAGVLDSRAPDAHVTALWAGEVCLAR